MSIRNYHYAHFLIYGDQKPSRLPREVKPGEIHIEKTNSTTSAHTKSLINQRTREMIHYLMKPYFPQISELNN